MKWLHPRTRRSAEAARVVRAARRNDIQLVRFIWCGNDGTIRAKASGRHALVGRLLGGVGVATAMQGLNNLDHLPHETGMGPVGELRLMPDLETFRVLPYAPRTAAVVADYTDLDGEPSDMCPRFFLRRMQSQLLKRTGTVLRATFETEFVLARASGDTFVPIDSALCSATIGMTAAQDYVDALLAGLDAQDIPVEQYCAEVGHGQHEVSVPHEPALRAADQQLFVRESIRGVAAAHGLVASLAPKPWADAEGNGSHIHFSLWDRRRNCFSDQNLPGVLSPLARAFAGGVIAHLPGLCGLTAPSFGSYSRLVPQRWAGALGCWGNDNREAALRIPSRFSEDLEGSTNLELKPVDASCNPYLALGGLIAAGLDGIDRDIDPPAVVDVDPATFSSADMAARNLHWLPSNQKHALDALQRDSVLTDALGPTLANTYGAVRLSEWVAYSRATADYCEQAHWLKY